MTFFSKALIVASLKAFQADAGNVTTSVDALYNEDLLDPYFWHPNSNNFEIIDWKKFEEKCGDTVPFVYDPPQRQTPIFEQDNIFAYGGSTWGRSENLSDEVIATGARPMTGSVSDPNMDLFYGILGQAPDPGLVPEPLRNKLFWMEDNDFGEYLLSFNRATWRKNTPEDRVIGLMDMGPDWTNAPTLFMFQVGQSMTGTLLSFQMSPSGKFIKFFMTPKNPSDPTIDGTWRDMYVVQEGDAFTDRDGNVLDYVQPGDIYRLTTPGMLDPYACYDDLRHAYFFRTVAVIDEGTGVISRGRDYDALIEAVTAEPPDEVKAATGNFTNSSGWTNEEKFDFLTTYVPDKQMYLSAPPPPPADLLNDIGEDEHNDSSKGSSGSEEPEGSGATIVASSLALLLVAAASLFF